MPIVSSALASFKLSSCTAAHPLNIFAAILTTVLSIAIALAIPLQQLVSEVLSHADVVERTTHVKSTLI